MYFYHSSLRIRCPTECRLSFSDQPWRCTVTLRFISGSDGRDLGQPHHELFGETIFDPSLVEDRVRRAQSAILNPSKISQDFLHGSIAHDHGPELTFSRGVVSLSITGPTLTDLSFVDLPGIDFLATDVCCSSTHLRFYRSDTKRGVSRKTIRHLSHHGACQGVHQQAYLHHHTDHELRRFVI